MNICSEHHEIKRKIGRIIVRILIKNCKRYFSLTKISVLYMFLKHDPKLWSLRKVLPNVSTVFGIWMKARIKHTEVFLVFFVWGFFVCFFFYFWLFFVFLSDAKLTFQSDCWLYISRYSIGLLPFVSKGHVKLEQISCTPRWFRCERVSDLCDMENDSMSSRFLCMD